MKVLYTKNYIKHTEEGISIFEVTITNEGVYLETINIEMREDGNIIGDYNMEKIL